MALAVPYLSQAEVFSLDGILAGLPEPLPQVGVDTTGTSSSAWSSIKATSLATSTGTPFSPWTVASEATGRAWILARATLRRQTVYPPSVTGTWACPLPQPSPQTNGHPPPSFGGGRLLVQEVRP